MKKQSRVDISKSMNIFHTNKGSNPINIRLLEMMSSLILIYFTVPTE